MREEREDTYERRGHRREETLERGGERADT